MRRREAEDHKTRADALADQGDQAGAKAAYREALRLAPEYFQAHANFANLLLAEGDADGAIRHFQQAVRLRPDIAELHDSLGRAFLADAAPDFARAAFMQALKLKPRLATAHCNLGRLFLLEEAYAGAVSAFQTALALTPTLVAAQLGLAEVLSHQGNTQQAREILDGLSADVPNVIGLNLYAYLARAERRYQDAETLWLELVKSPGAIPMDVRAAWFRIAELRDMTGDVAGASEALQHAHSMLKQPFDRELIRSRVDRLIEMYPAPDSLPSLAPNASVGFVPVFVLGMSRSGKSLTQRLLATHPGIYGMDERNSLAILMPARVGVSAVLGENEDVLTREELAQMATDYAEIAQECMADEGLSLAEGVTHIVSADPRNSWQVGLIHRVLPQARFIYVRRHPMDHCLACLFRNYAGTVHGYANDPESFSFYYREHDRLIAHWRHTLKIPVIDVQYEELIGDPASLRRRMFAELQINDGMTNLALVEGLGFSARQIGRWPQYREILRPMVDLLAKDGANMVPL